MKTKVRIDKAALRAHLTEQVAFLRASCRAFDQGEVAEAKRIAVQLRVLLHDTRRSRSLLSQLGSGFNWRFADTAFPFNPRNMLGHHGLVSIKIENTPPTGKASYEPLCESTRGLSLFVPFRVWWATAIVFRDSQGALFTRKDVVLTVANQDGGAHVDPELDGAYAALSKENSLGWQFKVDDEDVPWPSNPVPASIRQVGHEVLITLEAAELVAPEQEAG